MDKRHSNEDYNAGITEEKELQMQQHFKSNDLLKKNSFIFTWSSKFIISINKLSWANKNNDSPQDIRFYHYLKKHDNANENGRKTWVIFWTEKKFSLVYFEFCFLL